MDLRAHLLAGQVIPAHPLALTAHRQLDEVHQRALTRYYIAAGAGGIAVGVHTTQFAIRDSKHGLLRPVLELAARTADEALAGQPRPFAKIAGVVGRTVQALQEARTAHELGYDAALVSLGGSGWREVAERDLLQHCHIVGDTLPLFAFYLQPAVGGRLLSYSFWRALADHPSLVAIKIAPFDRYATLDVVRAVVESGRTDVALYTGNDDSIVTDLLTEFPARAGSTRRIVGGLLGQWAMWTSRAVSLLGEIRQGATMRSTRDWLALAARLTDANAAIFDAQHRFAGCIPGIHEVLRRQRLMAGTWTLEPDEVLSPGQLEEIDRVLAAYPELSDDAFVAAGIDAWLA